MYFSQARAAEALTPMHATDAPDLVIEITPKSTRKRDETTNRRLYERSGVRQYWVVGAEVDTVRVYRMTAARYSRPFSRETGDVLTSPSVVVSGSGDRCRRSRRPDKPGGARRSRGRPDISGVRDNVISAEADIAAKAPKTPEPPR